jgi:2-oxoisovalerate dehydrogenase E1 component
MIRINQIADISQLSAADYPNVSFVGVDEPYWRRQNRTQLAWGLLVMEIVRRFEQTLLMPEIESLIYGPVHSSIWQEAVAVGSALALQAGDKVAASHRAHHHFLAKAIGHYAPVGADLADQAVNESLRRCIRKTMAEIMGLREGWVGGRGGSMHLYDKASGNIGTQAIVGGNLPAAPGAALAEKMRGTGHVVVAYLGDGAISIGLFHEGVCMGKVYQLPVIFVIENNLYGVSTNARQATGMDDLVLRAAGHNMPGLVVDGMDPLAVKRAFELARQHASAGKGPVMIEEKTYRCCHHSGRFPGSAFGYRSKEEEQQWKDRDPLTVWPEQLIQRGLLERHEVERIGELAGELVDDARQFCTQPGQDGKPQIRPTLLPQAESSIVHVRSQGDEFEGIAYRDLPDYDQTRPMKMHQAIAAVLARRMETDPEVFVIGEDVANLRGGCYGATKDALARFPERVLNAPIAETGFVGLGHGAAAAGMKPIVEIMFCEFALVAADTLFNQIANFRYMYNGCASVPLVIRSRSSTGRGFGAQHSGDTVGLFALSPGWRIVAPTTPFDYIGLFNSAIRSLDPVLVLEHHGLWQLEGPVPEDDLDYCVQMGRAKVRRPGSDVTVIAYLGLVPRALEIAEQLAGDTGIDVEVIDLRTLDHANLDFDTIGSSVAKTGRVVVVEQTLPTQSLGPYIAATVHRRFGEHLKRPVALVSSQPAPLPVSKWLEQAVLVSDDQIHQAIVQATK